MRYILHTPGEPAQTMPATFTAERIARHPEAGLDDEERCDGHRKDQQQRRHFERQAEVSFGEWSPSDRRDLDYEIDHPSYGVVADPSYSSPISPFAVQPRAPQQDVFGVRDSLGRPKRSLRTSTGLSAQDCSKAYELVLRANAQNLAMSTHVVISWKLLGVMTDAHVHQAQAALLAALRDSAKRRRLQHGCFAADRKLIWIWVLERSASRGLHSHILFACPPAGRTRLLRSIVRALERITGVGRDEIVPTHLPYQRRASSPFEEREVSPVVMTAPPPLMNGETHWKREIRGQWALWRYIFKGLNDPSLDILHRAPLAQGFIAGQRWGHSTAYIGTKAWASACHDHFRHPAWFTNYVKQHGFTYPHDVLGGGSPVWNC